MNVAVHVVVLPAASATVMVTVVAPKLAVVPANGDCVIVNDEVQLSVAITPAVKFGTGAPHEATASAVWFDAQVTIVGTVVSTTVSVALQVELLPAASVTVIVTVIVTVFAPNEATAPANGDCVIVSDELQLSVATTPPVRSGITEAQLAAASSVCLESNRFFKMQVVRK